MMVISLIFLVLFRIDPRFLLILDASEGNVDLHSPFVFGPALATVALAVAGAIFQAKDKKKRKHKYEYTHPLIEP